MFSFTEFQHYNMPLLTKWTAVCDLKECSFPELCFSQKLQGVSEFTILGVENHHVFLP